MNTKTPAYSPGNPLELDLELRVLDGVIPYKDLLLCVFLLSLYPLLLLYLGRRFAKERWAESDYSPYYTGE